MNFENYTERLVPLTKFDTFEKPPANYKDLSRLTVFQVEIQKKTVTKTKFRNLTTRDFIFLMELPRCPCLIPI